MHLRNLKSVASSVPEILNEFKIYRQTTHRQMPLPGRLSLSSFRGRLMSNRVQLDVRNLSLGRRHLVNAYEVEAGIRCNLQVTLCDPYLNALSVRYCNKGAI